MMLEPNSPERLDQLRAANSADWQRVPDDPEDGITPEWLARHKTINRLDRLFLTADPEAFYARFSNDK